MPFIGSIRERLSIVSLNGDEYADALQASAALGIAGGGIYDAMLAHCAIKAKAKAIYTWNARHYALCGHGVKRTSLPREIDPRSTCQHSRPRRPSTRYLSSA
ncbi:MAG: hypothetical protein HYX27_02540 [Acidobacteria bacterium]|nr:hypothetical protein [Acidobacteriota bacterium]